MPSPAIPDDLYPISPHQRSACVEASTLPDYLRERHARRKNIRCLPADRDRAQRHRRHARKRSVHPVRVSGSHRQSRVVLHDPFLARVHRTSALRPPATALRLQFLRNHRPVRISPQLHRPVHPYGGLPHDDPRAAARAHLSRAQARRVYAGERDTQECAMPVGARSPCSSLLSWPWF